MENTAKIFEDWRRKHLECVIWDADQRNYRLVTGLLSRQIQFWLQQKCTKCGS